ncbi:MAG: tetratricopeptide repeat protein [Planctomycetota bacterium]|nr:tetratricopeptide repeat protein [Planctomycetota bacterium]
MNTRHEHRECTGAGRGWTWAFLVLLAAAVAPSRAADNAGARAYMDGLDALTAAKWADAEAAFSKAVDADEDNADYLTARGVARALGQKAPAAVKDLQRSLRMRDDWETKLWLCAALYMTGDAEAGSQYITHGPRGQQPTKADLDYSSFVYNVGLGCWQARDGGQTKVMIDGKIVEMSLIEARQRRFPRAAAMFVSRRQTEASPQLAGDLLARVKTNIQGKRYASAVKDLDSLLTASPEDDNLLLLRAECLLALGDYSGSRWEYTRVLTNQPTLAAGYAGRTQAAAHMVAPSPADPADALAQLEKAVRAGQAELRLAELALAVHQAVNARRLRYDEIYQDRLRVLDAALRADGKNPDRLADLAEFLFDESNPPFEQVEPRSWPVYYRYVPQGVPKFGRTGEILPAPPATRTAREVARARALADEALKANPEHVRSMGIKGTILNFHGEHGQALEILDKAVALKPNDFKLLRERSVAEQGIARADALAAAALRSPKITTTDNGNGTTTTTTVYPSAADLARADALDREAKIAHEKAVADMAQVMKLTAGTAMGAYYQGLTDYAYHNLPQAQADFQQAVKLDPKLRDAWEQLAKVNQELNLPEEWAAAREGQLQFIQTTAGPWLTVARGRMAKTQYKGARSALAAARRADAADSRANVYEALVDAANDKTDEALVRFHVALALENARNQLHGRSLAAPRPDALPPEPQDIALTLALRNNVGALLFGQGRTQPAVALFQANVDFLSSLPPEAMATPVPLAALPGAADVPANAPTETYATLKIRSQAGIDFAQWVARYNDPKDQAFAAETFKRLVCEAGAGVSNPVNLQAVVSLGLAELEVSKGNNARALELLRNEGATPQPLWQEMRKTEAAARGATQRQDARDYQKEQDRRSSLSAADAQRERLEAQKKQFQDLRQNTLESLNRPDVSDREKQVLQGSLAQYDRVIRDIDRKLAQLGAGGK